MRQIFISDAVSDEETVATMASTYSQCGYTLDPHSAVGVAAADRPHVREATAGAPVVCVLTAHPAKFVDACLKAGVPPARTAAIEALRDLPHRFEWLRAPSPPADKRVAWAATVKAAVERGAAARARRRGSQTQQQSEHGPDVPESARFRAKL